MRRSRALIALLLTLSLLLAGCNKNKTSSQSLPNGGTGTSQATSGADCPTSNTTSFAKTKFVLHVGLAAGTFHRYIYKPFQNGTFTSGHSGRITGMIKAGATALFDVHEIDKAIQDVKANPTLCKVIIGPLTALSSKFDALKSKITHGDTSGVTDLNSTVSSIESSAGSNGAAITESTNESQG